MSDRGVEAVRQWIDAYNRRDIESLLALSDPDIEFRSIFAAIESGGALRWQTGVNQYFRTLDDAYERFIVEADDYLDAGAAVVVVGRAVWRVKGSGASGETAIFVVSWLRRWVLLRVETL